MNVSAMQKSHEQSKDDVLMNQLSQQPDTLAPAENPFMPFGLSWKPNEDLSGELKADNRIRSVRTPSIVHAVAHQACCRGSLAKNQLLA